MATTTSYSLAPVPKWYIADQVGRPLGGGFLRTLSSQDHTLLKPVFSDPAGAFAWPYVPVTNNVGKTGIAFDENGSQGPFYFKFDTTAPDELYYLEVYNSAGVRIWTIDDFSPGSGGGGSIITTALDLQNLIVNGEFWRNISDNANPPTPITTSTYMVLAPGCHAGFAQTASALGSISGPDITFVKTNLLATDSISFPYFNLGDDDFGDDATPVQYLNYECTTTQLGELQKCLQVPITSKVQNLNGLDVTITVWARYNGGGARNLIVNWYDFYGDGPGASVDVPTPIDTLVLNNEWTKHTILTTVPDVTGKTLGGCGNDALFLQFQYPLGVPCNIDITKPSLYLGSNAPGQDFQSYDEIDGILNVPRTGDIRPNYSLLGTAPPGWIPFNDGSIGNLLSTATTRHNVDTFPLYNFLYTNVSDTYAPVSGGRTGSAINDFLANKILTLPLMLGRVLGSGGTGAGLTTRTLGETVGAESYSLLQSDLAQHIHQIAGQITTANNTGGGSNVGISAQNNSVTGGIDGYTTQTPFSLMQPTQFANFIIKL